MVKHKIFCLGLSRTGTTALANALNNLGIPTLHYSLSTFIQLEKLIPSQAFQPKIKLSAFRKWRLKKEILAYKSSSIDQIFDQYQGFADLPFPLLYRHLDQKFIDSRFIYTYRSEEKWLESMRWLFNEGAVIWKHSLLDDEIKFWAYKTNTYSSEHLLKVYRNHHNNVNQYFNNNPNYLSINLDKGELHYKTLTEFLNLKILDKPVEKINARRTPSVKESNKYWKKKNFDITALIYFLKNKI